MQPIQAGEWVTPDSQPARQAAVLQNIASRNGWLLEDSLVLSGTLDMIHPMRCLGYLRKV
jgi:hypothetical protein